MPPTEYYTIYRRQNDRQPNIQFLVERKPQPTDPPGTEPSIVDLTGYSATLKIVSQQTTVNTNAGHTSCTILTPATSGLVVYALQSGDLPDAGGYYLCDLTLTNGSSQPETWYSYLKIVTLKKL